MPTSNLFKKSFQYLIFSLGTILLMAGANTASAATLDVCASTCTYSTITAAHAAASALGGDTIEITGNITENVTIGIDRGVTITCSPGVTVDEVDFFSISAENVTIDGCEFTQSLTVCNPAGAAFITANNANDNIQITDNTIDNYAQALTSTNNTNLAFTGNTVTDVCAGGPVYLDTTTGSVSNNDFTQTASCFNGGTIGATTSTGLTISTNTITNYKSAITTSGIESFLILDNIFTNGCTDDGGTTIFDIGGDGGGTISGNEITSAMETGKFLNYNNTNPGSGDVYISDNTITGTATVKNGNGTTGMEISDDSESLDLHIEDNILKNDGYSSSTYFGVGIDAGDALSMDINHNVVAGFFSYGLAFENGIDITTLDINHNTIFGGPDTVDPFNYRYGLRFYDYTASPASEISITTATVKDNIFANTEDAWQISLELGEITTLDNDYNVYWDNTYDFNDTEGSTYEMGEESFDATDPALVDTINYDFSLEDFSGMIGAASDGGNIGHTTTPASRRTTIYVGGGAPDYSTIDDATGAALDGDTIVVAAGTYAEAVVIEDKDGITLTGAGSATTTIDGSGENFGLNLIHSDYITVSGFTIQDADQANLYVSGGSDNNDFSDLILSGVLSFSDSFSATTNPYSYLGNDYETLSGPGAGVIFLKGDNPATDIIDIEEAAQDITAIIEDPEQTWNLALANIDGAYATLFVNDDDFPNFGALSTFFAGFGSTATEDCWLDDVFVYSGDEYIYTAPTGCSGGSPDPTNTATPFITHGNLGAALEISSGDSNVIYDSTISDSILGVRFTGDATDNEIYQGGSGMTFSGNTDEIETSSSGDNIIKDIELSYDGMSATGAGSIDIYYKMRAYATLDGSPVEGASVTVSNSSDTIVFTGTTDASGYTSYSTDLSAEQITSLGLVDTGNSFTYSVISNSVQIASGSFDLGTESSTETMAGVTVVTPAIQSSGSVGGGSSTESSEADPAVQEPVEEPEVEDTPVPVVAPSNDQNALDAAINQFDGQIDEVISEPEEENVALIDEAELLEAIAEFDIDEEIVEVEVEKTEEELVVEEALLEDTDDKEVLEKAEEVVSETVSDSLEKALESAGEDGVNIRQDNQDFKISSLDEIEIVLGVGKDSDDLKDAKKKAKESGKALVVIDEKSNIDDDDVSDVYQITHGLPLFDKNPDNDAFDTADEIFLGLDPLKADELPDKTAVTNLKNKISGDLPSFRMIGLPPGGKVELFAVKKDSLTAEKVPGSVMMTNVLASIAPDSEQIKIGETIIDDKNKGEIRAETSLENGEYYLITKDQNGLGEVSSFTVDNKQAPKIESLEVVSKDAIGGGIKSSLQTVSAFFVFDHEAYINEKIEEIGVDRDTVIVRGEATPGSTVLVTWKSLIISSVVVSDASQGAFELEVPKKLAAGDHDVVTYAYNEKTNAVSSAVWLFFRK
jgi:hypothetical protein